MIKAVLIDDEPLARSLVREYLKPFSLITIVEECGNGYEGLKAIKTHSPDLIFLDIQMPKISGFEMLELIEGKLPAVIFTTAFDSYAMKAFEYNAVDYLLKPFSEERFAKAMEKWLKTNHETDKGVNELLAYPNKNKEEQNRIVVKEGSEIRIIAAQEIIFLEAFDDYVKIYCPAGQFLKKQTLSFYESVLDPSLFVRVHRSYILAISQLTKIEPLEKNSHIAILKNGTRVPLSRTGYALLKEKLGL